jgi:Icc-related predicted phosphoesterase
MKILAIGDFHGKFPLELKKLVKEVDLILSVGDYPSWKLRETFFLECYRGEKELWEVVGKKEYKKSKLSDIKTSEKILSFLNSLNIPVITTIGNYDMPEFNDTFDIKDKSENKWKWAEQDFFKEQMKKFPKIRRVDYRAINLGNLVIIGGYGHSFQGRVKSKAYKKHRERLDFLFKKYNNKNKEGKVIFLFHNAPYGCKLDVVRDKNADELVYGKHIGSKLNRRIIDKYQPTLAICGHLHENQGKCKIGETLTVNTGAAMDEKCAIIDFNEEKGRVKNIRFVK